jgi:hypothetical protein
MSRIGRATSSPIAQGRCTRCDLWRQLQRGCKSRKRRERHLKLAEAGRGSPHRVRTRPRALATRCVNTPDHEGVGVLSGPRSRVRNGAPARNDDNGVAAVPGAGCGGGGGFPGRGGPPFHRRGADGGLHAARGTRAHLKRLAGCGMPCGRARGGHRRMPPNRRGAWGGTNHVAACATPASTRFPKEPPPGAGCRSTSPCPRNPPPCTCHGAPWAAGALRRSPRAAVASGCRGVDNRRAARRACAAARPCRQQGTSSHASARPAPACPCSCLSQAWYQKASRWPFSGPIDPNTAPNAVGYSFMLTVRPPSCLAAAAAAMDGRQLPCQPWPDRRIKGRGGASIAQRDVPAWLPCACRSGTCAAARPPPPPWPSTCTAWS